MFAPSFSCVQNCGPRPAACPSAHRLKCIVDECACKWRWFSSDIRAPSRECNDALQQCTAPEDCPANFQCEEPSQQLKDELDVRVLEQLECTQEMCSCRPVLTAPETGVRSPCPEGQGYCCPDGLMPSPQCSNEEAQVSCSKVGGGRARWDGGGGRQLSLSLPWLVVLFLHYHSTCYLR